MPGRRYTLGRGLGTLVLLVLVAIVVFGDGGDQAPDPERSGGDRGRQSEQATEPPDSQPGEQTPGSGEQRPQRPPGAPARVIRVVDGDTVEVLIAGREEDVRYIGVDTPETVKPGEPVQCFGPQASAFNHRLVEGRKVRLVFDAERRDVYGRLLAYVYLRGELVNAELVRRGYARTLTIEPNDEHAPLFARLQRAAGRAGRGLWDACSPAQPDNR